MQSSFQKLLLCSAMALPVSGSSQYDTQVNVLGQSGKFTVYTEASGQGAGVQVTMDALYEVDADGNSVGASGNTKHSIQTFASQDFTIQNAEQVTLTDFNNISATKISFSSTVSTIGKIRVDTYVMGESGSVGTPSETWSVSSGDLKWNIELYEWTWCGCSQGNSQQVGEYIDLTVSVKGLQAPQATNSGNSSFDLGDDISLELSSQVNVDGAWQSMPSGYPKIVGSGSSTAFVFRFPKFQTSALYDPVLTGINPFSTFVGGASQRTSFWAFVVLGAAVLELGVLV